eukprot:26383_4
MTGTDSVADFPSVLLVAVAVAIAVGAVFVCGGCCGSSDWMLVASDDASWKESKHANSESSVAVVAASLSYGSGVADVVFPLDLF